VSLPLASLTLLVVAAAMIAEARRSRRNETRLRARGASEADHDVYPAMQVVYPTAFVAMAVEGGLAGTAPLSWWTMGAVMFAAAKALKYWAIRTLGARWTFRVLVVPGEPLVTSGPYRCLQHPNYLAVVGELGGMALMMSALVTGPLALISVGVLLWRRIAVEERMLRGAARAGPPEGGRL